jgi:serine palmitoyltransferase
LYVSPYASRLSFRHPFSSGTLSSTPLFFRVENSGYAPLTHDFECFYQRRLYKRIHDCFNRPVNSCPGAWMDVVVRERGVGEAGEGGNLVETGEVRRCLNLGSYNYLGFGDPDSTTKPEVFEALDKFSVATCSFRSAAGTTKLHTTLETLVARFVGKEAAMVFSMGFGTNSVGIPALSGGQGTLIISDSNNHSSIVVGARSSGAQIKVFQHNDAKHLEEVVRKAIVDGQPRSHRPWKKIIIIVEGIYSMEGEMCPLNEIVAVKKKYRCYLYVDEAHSIGALGANGRGICEYKGVDPADIDVLMGTFTKSFGAVGGYIAASTEVIAFLRTASMGSVYSSCISPPATQQVISAMKIIMGEDGTDLGQRKLTQLRNNANFFRLRMKQMGCHVLGDWDSPIVPVMLYTPSKIPAFSRECFARNLAVVVVGFPAAPLLLARTRFCISAAHTQEDLEKALEQINEVCDEVQIKYGTPSTEARIEYAH